MEKKFQVVYWKYTEKTNRQISYEYDDYKKALKRLNALGEKGHYVELWYGKKMLDYRN